MWIISVIFAKITKTTIKMKKYTLFFALIACFLFIGCSSNDDDETKDTTSVEMKKFVGKWDLSKHKDEGSSNPYMTDWHNWGLHEEGTYYLIVNPDYTYVLKLPVEEEGTLRVDEFKTVYFGTRSFKYEFEGTGTLILQQGTKEFFKFVKK